MEEFDRKCKEVLAAFKNLSGYKITFYNQTVKLQSVYVKSKDNFFVFKVLYTFHARNI